MGVSAYRLKEKEQVREAILTKAWEMVQADGWDALSIRKIAEAVNYSVPVIYDYFENKEALLVEFSREGYRRLTRKMELARQKQSSPEQQLRAMAEAYWNFALRNQAYYKIMYGVGMPCCKCEAEDKEGFDNHIMDAIREIAARSKYKPVNVCLKYHTFWSILHGLVSIKLSAHSAQDRELNKLVLQDAVEGFIKNLK
jgi:AcrR family transcriptional regulator